MDLGCAPIEKHVRNRAPPHEADELQSIVVYRHSFEEMAQGQRERFLVGALGSYCHLLLSPSCYTQTRGYLAAARSVVARVTRRPPPSASTAIELIHGSSSSYPLTRDARPAVVGGSLGHTAEFGS